MILGMQSESMGGGKGLKVSLMLRLAEREMVCMKFHEVLILK